MLCLTVMKLSIDSIFYCYADGALFDASQYAFFGKDVAEEVELGGLDDVNDYIPSVTFNEEEFFHNEEEVVFSIS